MKRTNLIIILPEIYGINDFIKGQASLYLGLGFDVEIFNYGRSFSYSEEKEAYRFFMEEKGFDTGEIEELVREKRRHYEKILLLGFSVGASLAYRAGSRVPLEGVVCLYGSRIRDYLDEKPSLPSLVILSQDEDYYLEEDQLRLVKLAGPHGFMDSYSSGFKEEARARAQELIEGFLRRL